MANEKNEKLEADKKQLAADRAAREKQMAEKAKNAGTPTPTQEEADLLKLGNHVELAPDGSPPDPNNFNPAHKEAAGGHGAPYQTRQATPAHQGAHRTKE